MSDETEVKEKCFHPVSVEQGTFTLYDKVFQCHREWTIDDDSPVGVSILLEKLEKEGDKIQNMLPDKITSITDKQERSKKIQNYISNLDDEERAERVDRIQQMSMKQLAVMSTFCVPGFDIPDIWENKMECLASCLSDNQDPAKINAFFLMKSIGSTAYQGDLEQAMKEIIKSL